MKADNGSKKTGSKALDELLRRATAPGAGQDDAVPPAAEAMPAADEADVPAAPVPDAGDDVRQAASPQAAPETPKEPSDREERARRAFRRLVDVEEEGDVSLRSVLGGDILGSRRFRRLIWYLLLLTVMAVIYVSNRYAYQREEIRRADLAKELTDRQYKALTVSSELTEYSMRSNVEERLTDTTLQISTSASFYIVPDSAAAR